MGQHTSHKYEGTQHLIIELRLRDQGECDTCPWCDRPMLPVGPRHRNDPDAPSVEHITPRALGGTDELDNLVLVHRRCNSAWRPS